MVSVLVITVASFQQRHNARYTTLESLKKSSMRFKLGTLMRSESQREKGSVRVRAGGDASFSPTPRWTRRPCLGQRTSSADSR
jgi:hypothetical protein